MYRMKNWFIPAVLITTGLVSIQLSAQNTAGCYTLDSLQGSYGVVVTYGANVALGLQPEVLDGRGNLTRTGINNQPTVGSATGARTVANVTSTGTYSVNCNGTGTITRLVTRADGTTATASDDFLITQSIEKDGRRIATAMVDAQQDPSVIVPGGIFVTRAHTLRPNAGCYTLDSLAGTYAVAVNYGANVALGIQPENLDGKGNLNRTGTLNQPTAGSATGARTVGPVTSVGTYIVNCNGTGTITRIVTRADGTTAQAVDDFLVTQATEKDGKLLATTIVDAQRDPSVILPGGVFVFRTHTLLQPLPPPSVTPPSPTQKVTKAVAGPKNYTSLYRTMQLDGTQSVSGDGKSLTYLWTIPAGTPSAAMIGATTATPTVQFGVGLATYTFQLTVTDSTGATATDSVTVAYQGN